MYRKFASKELAKKKSSSPSDETDDSDLGLGEVRQTLSDFAKGLINSYLLNAINFAASTSEFDDEPINVANRVFYKRELAQVVDTMEKRAAQIDETLLDELQFKIYLLMKQKYYPDFKNYPEFHKILLKNDLIFKLGVSANSITMGLENRNLEPKFDDYDLDSVTTITSTSLPTGTDSDAAFGAGLDTIDENNDAVSQSSFDLCLTEAATIKLPKSDSLTGQYPNNNPKNMQLTAVITSSGRCNEMNTIYAIYIIDVNKMCLLTNKLETWQTYRRFNDFHDLHMLVKKKFPSSFSKLTLPGKSLRSSLKDEFLEKRRIELNKYLQVRNYLL